MTARSADDAQRVVEEHLAESAVDAPAHGFPGGGWQVRFRDITTDEYVPVRDLGPDGWGILS